MVVTIITGKKILGQLSGWTRNLPEEKNSGMDGERSMILLIRYTNDRGLLFSNHIVFLFSALSLH
jgi:hypothetical protein